MFDINFIRYDADHLQRIVVDYQDHHDDTGERQKFCVHGIIGARQTGASNEHEHQTQFS